VALGLTLLFISILTRQLLHPLQELNRMAEMITTESLDHAQIKLDQAPREVEELALVFNNLLERLGRSWNQQRDFVSAVSHELRNPLTIIGGYLRRLQRRGGNLSPEQLRALATAEAETQRITRLLNDLLDLSRSEAGRLQLLLKPVAVDEVLLTSCDLVRSQLPRRLELTLPTGDDSFLAVTEADRLQQVVLNLIENADKYSPPGTPIQVILTTDLPDYLRITVRDRGIGIPADDQATIFERFQRGSNAAAKGSGSGLGLSVVKLLVDAMGGRISVESQLGEGSAFHLDLPRPPEATATPGPLPRRRPAQ
jgi:signal transduction histidine kinase